MQLSICCVCCLFLEDAVHRDFKVLPKGFMSIVLESFLPCSSKRNLFPHGPAKVAELGCELSFLGFECIARGAMYEACTLQCIMKQFRRIYCTESQHLAMIFSPGMVACLLFVGLHYCF